jgi:hypothetical protein
MASMGRYLVQRVEKQLEASVTENYASAPEIKAILEKHQYGGTVDTKKKLIGPILNRKDAITAKIRSLNQAQLADEFKTVCGDLSSKDLTSKHHFGSVGTSSLLHNIGSVYDHFNHLQQNVTSEA